MDFFFDSFDSNSSFTYSRIFIPKRSKPNFTIFSVRQAPWLKASKWIPAGCSLSLQTQIFHQQLMKCSYSFCDRGVTSNSLLLFWRGFFSGTNRKSHLQTSAISLKKDSPPNQIKLFLRSVLKISFTFANQSIYATGIA